MRVNSVAEAATVTEQFKGKRVAYSVFGSVKSLKGEAEDKVVIEALDAQVTICWDSSNLV